MAERSGYLRKREGAKGTTWQVVLRVGRHPVTGKRTTKVYSGFKTKKEATSAMRRLLVELEDRTWVGPVRGTLGQYLTSVWLPAHAREVRPNTLAGYELQLGAYVLPHIGSTPLQEVSSPMLSGLYDLLMKRGGQGGRPLAAKTVRNVHIVLHRAFEDAVGWELVKVNPAAGAKPPSTTMASKPAAAMVTWTPEQVRVFLAHVADDRLVALWRLMLVTGMRRSEALGLRWQDLDLKAGTLAIVRTLVKVDGGQPVFSIPKTARSRRVLHIDDTTVAMLKAHKKRQAEERLAWASSYTDTGLVFSREDGSPLRPATVTRQFQRLQEGLGVPRIGTHGCRHTWATNALRSGIPLKVVSEQLGHASVATTGDTYSHVPTAVGSDAADVVAGLYS